MSETASYNISDIHCYSLVSSEMKFYTKFENGVLNLKLGFCVFSLGSPYILSYLKTLQLVQHWIFGIKPKCVTLSIVIRKAAESKNISRFH